MNWWPAAVLLLTADAVLTLKGARHGRADAARYAWWALADTLGGVAMLAVHVWPASVPLLAFAAWWLWMWWNRRKRGRAKAWLGAKSRALRDALVRRQREAWKPRPVLRPVPGGVR